MQECTWKRDRDALNMESKGNYKLTETKILAVVKAGTLFRCVLSDIHVPNNRTTRNKFAEMTPIFKNCKISRDDIDPYMRQVVEKTWKIFNW